MFRCLSFHSIQLFEERPKQKEAVKLVNILSDIIIN